MFGISSLKEKQLMRQLMYFWIFVSCHVLLAAVFLEMWHYSQNYFVFPDLSIADDIFIIILGMTLINDSVLRAFVYLKKPIPGWLIRFSLLYKKETHYQNQSDLYVIRALSTLILSLLLAGCAFFAFYSNFCLQNLDIRFCAASYPIPFLAEIRPTAVVMLGVSSFLFIILIFSLALVTIATAGDTKLNPQQKIYGLLEKDESKWLEFKSTLQTPAGGIPKPEIEAGQRIFKLGKQKFKSEKEIQKYLQTQCLKSVCGFLNSEGGDLIIGVKELNNRKKETLDIKNEIGFSNLDQFERHFAQLISNRIGQNFLAQYVQTEFHHFGKKTLLLVRVKKFIPLIGQIPALLDGELLFTRTGPRTDPVAPGKPFAEFVSGRRQMSGFFQKTINRLKGN